MIDSQFDGRHQAQANELPNGKFVGAIVWVITKDGRELKTPFMLDAEASAKQFDTPDEAIEHARALFDQQARQ